jgi:hypothetical protein
MPGDAPTTVIPLVVPVVCVGVQFNPQLPSSLALPGGGRPCSIAVIAARGPSTPRRRATFSTHARRAGSLSRTAQSSRAGTRTSRSAEARTRRATTSGASSTPPSPASWNACSYLRLAPAQSRRSPTMVAASRRMESSLATSFNSVSAWSICSLSADVSSSSSRRRASSSTVLASAQRAWRCRPAAFSSAATTASSRSARFLAASACRSARCCCTNRPTPAPVTATASTAAARPSPRRRRLRSSCALTWLAARSVSTCRSRSRIDC